MQAGKGVVIPEPDGMLALKPSYGPRETARSQAQALPDAVRAGLSAETCSGDDCLQNRYFVIPLFAKPTPELVGQRAK